MTEQTEDTNRPVGDDSWEADFLAEIGPGTTKDSDESQRQEEDEEEKEEDGEGDSFFVLALPKLKTKRGTNTTNQHQLFDASSVTNILIFVTICVYMHF